MIDYHTAFTSLAGTINQLTDFLGVDRFVTSPGQQYQRARPIELATAGPSVADVSLLASLYEVDVVEFAALSGLDVSSWPTAQITAGALAPAEAAAAMAQQPAPAASLAAGAADGRRGRAK